MLQKTFTSANAYEAYAFAYSKDEIFTTYKSIHIFCNIQNECKIYIVKYIFRNFLEPEF